MKLIIKFSAAALAVLALVALGGGIVSAKTVTTTANPSTKITAEIDRLIAQGDKEIAARIDAITKLAASFGEIKKLTSEQVATLTATLQSQINELNSLKAKIDAETDVVTLKADVAAIAKAYRIYLLVMPQVRISAAADRIGVVVDALNAVVTKLASLISAAQAAGKNVTALQAKLDDLKAKLADATTQSQAAINYVTGLTPDNGNPTVAASNKAALTKARADLRVGTQDLKTAHADARAIVKAYKAFRLPGTATTTSATSTENR